MYRNTFLVLILSLATLGAQTQKGFLVRFLSNPEPVTKYSIYRSTNLGSPGTKVGEMAPSAIDTLEFGDLQIVKGTAYFYSVTSTNTNGVESEFSSQSAVAYPSLNLPDTIRSLPSLGSAEFVLDAKSDPLANFAPLDVQLEGASALNVAYVANTHTLVFTSKLGQLLKTKVKVRALYYGEFQDLDSTVIVISTLVSVNPSIPAFRLAPLISNSQHGSILFSHLPVSGDLRIFTLQGRTAFQQQFTTLDGTLTWDGKIEGGVQGSQLLSYRVIDESGRMAGSGHFQLQR